MTCQALLWRPRAGSPGSRGDSPLAGYSRSGARALGDAPRRSRAHPMRFTTAVTRSRQAYSASRARSNLVKVRLEYVQSDGERTEHAEMVEGVKQRPFPVEDGHLVAFADPDPGDTEEAGLSDGKHLVARPGDDPGGPAGPRSRPAPGWKRAPREEMVMVEDSCSVRPQCCRADQWLTADGAASAVPMAKGWALGRPVPRSFMA